ncbi:hypothetical protein PUW24_12625 [Paenibacillus urinalis]|uniref:Uncharacterized protein n=1 Tax=Paenibacillus urinalis TaxID=521520 RepID=A0AAX3N4S5_9BACL|nr:MULTISPECIES: hypothetical protein [Paenibacillus]WDH83632.1 hypothetical protein PUW23_05210 [Paenibacillus urinalis]WDH99660.1 hypothetical protein PUW24_12625 [Paenibacillus urinalis]WDI03292.1 hypothetical protein PUW25_04755 [Paenibacillus urinalis]
MLKRKCTAVIMTLLLSASLASGVHADAYGADQTHAASVSADQSTNGPLSLEESETSKEIQQRLMEQYDLEEPAPEPPNYSVDYGISFNWDEFDPSEFVRWMMIMLTLAF